MSEPSTAASLVERDQIIIHNSIVSSLADCERKFHYEYVLGWETMGSRAMDRGTWFHALAAADDFRRGLRLGSLLAAPDKVDLGVEGLREVPLEEAAKGSKHVLGLLCEVAWDVLPEGDRVDLNGDDTVYEGMDFPQQVLNLYTRWAYHHRRTLPKEQPLLVEHLWSRKDEATGLTYGGRIDEVVKREDGLVVVRDRKTTAKLPSAAYRLTSSQLLLYAWGVQGLMDDFDMTVRFVELDYAITKTPGNLRLTKPTEKIPTGRPYANVGDIDEFSLVKQIQALGMEPDHEVFEKLWAKTRGWTNDEHPFFRRWEMAANPVTIRQILDENAVSWGHAKELLLEQRMPVRNQHPILCGMCRMKDPCMTDLYGAESPAPFPATRTLPVIGGGKTQSPKFDNNTQPDDPFEGLIPSEIEDML